jgi:DNA-binding PadR family transcriptional regulator
VREPTFLILTALTGSPLHGYAILGEVEKISDGTVSMQVGTLYAALDRLGGEGLVEVESEEVVRGRLRRTYRLTGAGHAALSAEAEKLRALAAKARSRLVAHPSPRLAGGGA